MRLLITDPDLLKSAKNLRNGRLVFDQIKVCLGFLEILERESIYLDECFKEKTFAEKVNPKFKCFYGENFKYKGFLKLYYNLLLKVLKEDYSYKTKYEFFNLKEEKVEFPSNFTGLTLESNKAILIYKDELLYSCQFPGSSKYFNETQQIFEFLDFESGELKKMINFGGVTILRENFCDFMKSLSKKDQSKYFSYFSNQVDFLLDFDNNKEYIKYFV